MAKIGERNGTIEEMRARGDALRARLVEKGISLNDFGDLTGLSRNQVYRLTKGQQPTADQQVRIDGVLAKEIARQSD